MQRQNYIGDILDITPDKLSNINIELAKRQFKFFVKEFWEEVDPEPYIENWVHDCLCDHLQAVYEGNLPRLVINIPPGLGKSVIVSVMFPVWIWLQDPAYSTLCATRASGNLKRDSNKFFNLLNSPKFKLNFSHMFKVGSEARKDSGNKVSEDYKEIHNSNKGFRRAITTGSNTTGARGKIILLDDPNDRKDAFSKTDRSSINNYVFKTLANRTFAKLGGSVVIIMQRLHPEDVSGIAIEKGYPLLSLPMEYDGMSSFALDSWSDPRKDGEFLIPEIFDESSKKQIIVDFGSKEYQTQYQQRPAKIEGSIIKHDWIKYYDHDINTAHEFIMSWDMAFKGTDESDYVVGQVWAKQPMSSQYYLVDQIRGKWDFPKTIEKFMELCRKYPQATKKIVESKANGQAVIDTLKNKIAGIVPYSPKDSKESRLNSVAPLFEAGNIYLPKRKDFTDDFVDELTNFPYHKNDDQVDACVQALINFKSSGAAFAFVKSNHVIPLMN